MCIKNPEKKPTIGYNNKLFSYGYVHFPPFNISLRLKRFTVSIVILTIRIVTIVGKIWIRNFSQEKLGYAIPIRAKTEPRVRKAPKEATTVFVLEVIQVPNAKVILNLYLKPQL